MRDVTRFWGLAPDLPATFEAPGLRLTQLPPARLQLCSGPGVRGWLADQGLPCIGWPEIAQGESFALSLRRDQILVVGGEATAEGWVPSLGCAITDVSDGWTGFRLEGDAASTLLSRAAEVRLDRPSASVARPLFGFAALLHRHGSPTTHHLHFRSAEGPAAWQRLLAEAARIRGAPPLPKTMECEDR